MKPNIRKLSLRKDFIYALGSRELARACGGGLARNGDAALVGDSGHLCPSPEIAVTPRG